MKLGAKYLYLTVLLIMTMIDVRVSNSRDCRITVTKPHLKNFTAQDLCKTRVTRKQSLAGPYKFLPTGEVIYHTAVTRATCTTSSARS